MKTVVNKTRRPIRVSLPGGKALHLGPGHSGQVSDAAVERPSFRKLVESGKIEVSGDGGNPRAGGEPRTVHESTSGHGQPKVVHPSGNR